MATGALELDPASPGNSHNLAVQLFLAGRFDEAIEQSRKTLELDPTVAVAYSVIGQSFSAKGMDREGLPADEKYSELSRGSAMSLALLGYTHARIGERSQALHAIQQLTAASKQTYTPAFSFAWIYAGLGDKDHAFEWLEKAREERFTRLAYLRQEAFWKPLRSDPRFSEFTASHRISAVASGFATKASAHPVHQALLVRLLPLIERIEVDFLV